MEKEVLVKVEIVARKFKSNDGKDFLSFKTFLKNGNKITLKFRQCVSNAPKEEGTYYAVVKANSVSINNNKKYPEMWIQEDIVKYIDNEELAKDYTKRVAEVLEKYEN